MQLVRYFMEDKSSDATHHEVADEGNLNGIFKSILLFALNVVHIGEPETGEKQALKSLRDGSLPSSDMLNAINDISGHRMDEIVQDELGEWGFATAPKGSRPHAKSRLRGMGLLLLHAKCSLAARGTAHEDLLIKYLKSGVQLESEGDMRKRIQRYRATFKGIGVLDSAETTMFLVRWILSRAAQEAR